MTRARSLSRLANSTVFTVSDTNRVGIGSTIPDVKLDVGGKAIIDETTQSTTTTSGALVVSGGVGIAKNLFVGGSMSVAGTLTYEDVTNSETAGVTTTGGLIVTGLGATFGSISTHFSNIEFGAAGVGGTITPLGHAEFVGVVTASSFSGDGSGLTGVASTDNINTSTLAQFTGGVGIADSIFHIGDDNTAIRFPGSDTFTVETSGSEALRVDGGQRLLIGATSTRGTHGGGNAQLQVEGTNTATAGMSITRTSADAGSPTFSFGKTRNGSALSDGDDVGVIYWQGDDGTDLATAMCSIKGEVDGSVSGNAVPGRITFNTATTSTNLTERLRIDSTGRVLLNGGTTARANMLNSTFTSQFQIEGTGHTTSSMSMVRNTNDGSSPYLTIGKSRSTSVNGTGLVSSGDGLGVISWQGGDGSNLIEAAAILAQVDGTAATDDMPGRLLFYTTSDGAAASTERARIDSSGRLLIGTTTEGSTSADNLTIADSSHCGMTIRSSSSTSGSIYFSDATSGDGEYDGYVQYSHLGRTLNLGAGAATRVVIQSDGDVLPGSDDAQDLGATDKRWANIYSADLQLSNEGKGNDVDGTWGKYTIQEGENDLFLLNRRNGKKYRFMLEEV